MNHPGPQSPLPLPFHEFVALIAMLMAMSALGVDMMLPALPDIGHALNVADRNDYQWVVTVFGAGFGASQILHGPIIDRFGRRRVLLIALGVYALINAMAAASQSFAVLLAARLLSGAAVSAVRVAALTIVRDCHEGEAMARMLSLAFMVFMAFPILAPALGAGVLLVGNWRDIFWVIAALSIVALVWVGLRLPETQPREGRRAFHLATIAAGWKATASDPLSLAYTLAITGLTGAFYGYLGSIQPIMAYRFGQPHLLLVVFAFSAGMMMMANLANARLVMRLGTRRLGRYAAVVMAAAAAGQLALSLAGMESIVSFAMLQAIILSCFAVAGANFSAIALERMGALAGTASGLQGFTSLTFGAILGALIGHGFDGTTHILSAGFLACALAALALGWLGELAAERARKSGIVSN